MTWLTQLRNQPATLLVVVTYALFVDFYLYGMVIPLSAVSPAKVVDPGLVSILYGGYAAGLIAATPIIGILTDRIGPKTAMVLGVFIQILATLFSCFGNSFPEMLAGRILMGIAASATWTAGLTLLATQFQEHRVKVMGFALVGSTIGSVLGPSLSGLMYEYGTFTMPFMFALVLLALDATMRIALIKNYEGHKTSLEKVRQVLGDKTVIAASIAVALAAVSWALLEPLIPDHLSHHFAASPALVGITLTVATVAYAIATPFVGTIAEKLGVRTTIQIGLAMTALSLPLLTLTNTWLLAAGAICLTSIAYAFTLNPTSAELANAIDRRGLDCYAYAYAIYNLVYALGMIGSDAIVHLCAHKLTELQMTMIMSLLFALSIPLFNQRRSPQQ